MRRYGYAIALGMVLLLGGALRIYHLGSVPTELAADEIELYNSAQSIAATGHDVDGSLLPYLYSPLTRNPPVYAIAGYASALVFGKTAFGLRLPAVFFGLISISLLYGIVLELTGRRDAALAAALVTAVSPIFVQFSRTAWEPSSELPFLLGGLYVTIRTFRRAERGELSFAGLAGGALLLAATAYTYMAGWFYAALLGVALLALNVRRYRTAADWMKVSTSCAVWLAAAAPALWMWFFDSHTIGRTDRIATFAQGVSPLSLAIFAHNYAAHFRWSFLATTGDPQNGVTWRYLNGFGAFYWWVIPLALLGLLWSAKYLRETWTVGFVWIWLLAYPLGGALTNEGAPNAPRVLAGAPVFCVLAALGFAFLIDWSRSLQPQFARLARVAVPALLVAAAGVSAVQFSAYYFTEYVHVNSNAWASGSGAMFAAVQARAGQYRRVCFSVYPAWYAIDSYIRFYLTGVPIEAIDTLQDPRCALPGTLLVTDADHPLPHLRALVTIRDVNGSPFARMYDAPAR
jgi:4-amino-4-deoxy-L-arabinose transferase-like glycosyltransferase